MIFGALSGSRRKRVNEKLERRSEIEIQKSLTKVFYEEPCKGAVYATHFGLTPGTGVWVLEGSKDNHELLIKASTDASPGWNTRLKKAGAVYFDHCKLTPIELQARSFQLTFRNQRGGAS
jgi:hypothetical protein